MNTAMRTRPFPLLCALLSPTLPAYAQASDHSAAVAQIITPAHPVWLLEQPDADSPLLTARTYGDSTYGDYKVKATLAISCPPQNPAANLSLQIAPGQLGFDSDAFEGPDASANGPLRIVTGERAALERPVSGAWTYAGAFQVGTVFALDTSIPRDELAFWASDAARGLPLTLSLVPAQAGGQELKARFTLPDDNLGLKKAFSACLGTTARQ